LAYIYAGLGIAMMAGIMAIFEFGLSITGQEGQLLPPVDPYFEVEGLLQRNADREFLVLLNSPDVLLAMGEQSSQSLCNCLKCRVKPLGKDNSDTNLCERSILTSPHCEANEDIAQEYLFLDGYVDKPVLGSAPDNSFFASACVLTSISADHRVLVRPNDIDPVSPYEIYSCSGSRCSFE